MRILPELLAELVPSLSKLAPETLAERLTNLGFETDILPGKTPVLDVEITPNRGDAMSHLGLARDLAAQAALRRDAAPNPVQLCANGELEALPELTTFNVVAKPAAVCPQYHAVFFDNVVVQPSPEWLQTRLSLLSIRPINNIVDVTNYLMELYGQPLHAFDADALLGDTLTIREAQAGETMTTLDGTEHTLAKGVLVAEDREGLVDLVGIQGGLNSQVQASTTRILLQSALFDIAHIRAAMNALNHRTEAAVRYEHGVDPALSIPVLEQAVKLLVSKSFGKARAVGKLLAKTVETPPSAISYDPDAVSHLLGFTIRRDQQIRSLELLGCSVVLTKSTYLVQPPTWRYDLELWQDVAEEVARLAGLNEVVPVKSLPNWNGEIQRSEFEWAEGLKDRLVELSLSEVQTYSFISEDDLARFALQNVGELANPLNPALRYLRSSLFPNLARVIASNSVFDPILIFEIGHTHTQKNERMTLGIAIAGRTSDGAQWLARIADAVGMDSADLTAAVTVLTLDQAQRDAYKIRKTMVTLIEVPLSVLSAARRIPKRYAIPKTIVKYRSISKYPPVARDMSLIIDRDVAAAAILDTIKTFSSLVESTEVFDEYVSDRLGEHKKSLAFHIYYADPNRTLTDTDVNDTHAALEQALCAAFDAEVR